MFEYLKTRIVDWPRPARYFYFLVSNLKFRSYRVWQDEGEPNPFVRPPRRRRQTNEQEIADIFRMTSKELAAFGKSGVARVGSRQKSA